MIQHSSPKHIPRGIESKDSNRHLDTNGHSSIIHSNQKVKTIRVHQRMNG